jgi:hypothetical protein
VRLTELHLAAEQEMLAMDIATGEHVTAIAELRALLAEHPFRLSVIPEIHQRSFCLMGVRCLHSFTR